MRKQTIEIGSRVMFTCAGIRQVGNSARTANMRGTILQIYGQVACVDCEHTFVSGDGSIIRTIPLANLRLVKQ